jgi:hypothetical protein
MNWQTIVVGVLITAAAGYVIAYLASSVFGLGRAGCGDCGTAKIDEFRHSQNSGDAAPDGFVASDDVAVPDE